MYFLKNLTKLSSKKMLTVFGILGLYLISAGISWVVFSYLVTSPQTTKVSDSVGRPKIDPNAPKTEECPINGAKFTRQEKDIWDQRRPLTVMAENHADSRPPSGMSKADVVYEAVAEGGITRFLAVFYCGVSAEDVKVAPVRSARIYFVDWASEYGDKPIFMHVGGSNNFCSDCPGRQKMPGTVAKEVRAIELLETIGWRVSKGNDFDTAYDIGFPVMWRNYERLDHPVATEHTMMASTDTAFEEAAKRGFVSQDNTGKRWDEKFIKWRFIDGQPSDGQAVSSIKFSFWDNKPEYDVEWKYDPSGNKYLRFNGGQAHLDLENKEQLTASNVLIMFVKERGPVDKEGHMFYTTTGTGKALIFQEGRVIEGTWEKDSRVDRTKFVDESGKEISLVRGVTWIEAVPSTNKIEY